jgi:hypothetical protein
MVDAKGLKSDPATVTINVAPNRAPTAVADSATLGVPSSTPWPTTPIRKATGRRRQRHPTDPAAGRGRSSNGNTITYTPPATVTAAFTTTFTYIARDSIGALSTPGTVTVQVSPRPPQETFAVTAATVTARPTTATTGTSAVPHR